MLRVGMATVFGLCMTVGGLAEELATRDDFVAHVLEQAPEPKTTQLVQDGTLPLVRLRYFTGQAHDQAPREFFHSIRNLSSKGAVFQWHDLSFGRSAFRPLPPGEFDYVSYPLAPGQQDVPFVSGPLRLQMGAPHVEQVSSYPVQAKQADAGDWYGLIASFFNRGSGDEGMRIPLTLFASYTPDRSLDLLLDQRVLHASSIAVQPWAFGVGAESFRDELSAAGADVRDSASFQGLAGDGAGAILETLAGLTNPEAPFVQFSQAAPLDLAFDTTEEMANPVQTAVMVFDAKGVLVGAVGLTLGARVDF